MFCALSSTPPMNGVTSKMTLHVSGTRISKPPINAKILIYRLAVGQHRVAQVQLAASHERRQLAAAKLARGDAPIESTHHGHRRHQRRGSSPCTLPTAPSATCSTTSARHVRHRPAPPFSCVAILHLRSSAARCGRRPARAAAASSSRCLTCRKPSRLPSSTTPTKIQIAAPDHAGRRAGLNDVHEADRNQHDRPELQEVPRPQDVQVVEREEHADDGNRDAEDELTGDPKAGFHPAYSTFSCTRDPRRKTSFQTMVPPTATMNNGHDSWNRSTRI